MRYFTAMLIDAQANRCKSGLCFTAFCFSKEMKKVLSLYFGCHCCIAINAQDFSMIGKKNPVEVSGGLALNQIIYSAFNGPSRRDPYSYVASGNVNLSLYGWSVPLTFTVSNQGNSFQQPFNNYSLHPTYKAISAHAGYISCSYSPYSVSGHNFLGGAIDYEPEGKFRISALYGRFLRSLNLDSAQNILPVFERWGYGLKANYIHSAHSLQLVVFHAHDKARSIHFVPDSLNLHPQENLVVSLGASTVLLKKFVFKAEAASSAVTSNTSAEADSRSNIFSNVQPLYTLRASSDIYNAYKGNLDYQHQNFTVGLGYEHIDPGYRTFGAYFFNNDLENVTLNASTSLVDGKLSLATSIGKQQDNLDGTKVATLERTVGSLNVGFAPSEKLMLSVSYSTFQSFTNIRSQFQEINQLTPYENIDTLNFTQLSRSASANATYSFGRDEQRKQNVNFNLSAQGASEGQAGASQNSGSWFYNMNCGYSINLQPQAMVMSVSVNGSMNEGPGASKTIGPMASVSHSFFEKKLKTNFSVNYNQTQSGDAVPKNETINCRIGCVLNLKKKHNVNANIAVQARKNSATPGNTVCDMTAMVGYNYAFAWKK